MGDLKQGPGFSFSICKVRTIMSHLPRRGEGTSELLEDSGRQMQGGHHAFIPVVITSCHLEET